MAAALRKLLNDEPLRGQLHDPLGPAIAATPLVCPGGATKKGKGECEAANAQEEQHQHLSNITGACLVAMCWWNLMGCSEGVIVPGFRPDCTFPMDDDVLSLPSRDEALTTVFYLPALLVAMGMRMRSCTGHAFDAVTQRAAALLLAGCFFLWMWPDPSSLASVSPLSNHFWLLIVLFVFRGCLLQLRASNGTRMRRLAVLPVAISSYFAICTVAWYVLGIQFHLYQVTAFVYIAVGLQLPTGLLGKTWPLAVQSFVAIGAAVILQFCIKGPSFIQAYIGQSLVLTGVADVNALPLGVQIGAFLREFFFGVGTFLGLLLVVPSHYVPLLQELGFDPIASWCLIPFAIHSGRSSWRVYFLKYVRRRSHNLLFEFITYLLTVVGVSTLVALPPTRLLYDRASFLIWHGVCAPFTCAGGLARLFRRCCRCC